MKLTEQDPDESVQDVELKNPTGPASLNDTRPAGTIDVPPLVSDTVTLQVEDWLTTTGLVQVIVVEVAREPTEMTKAPLVLPMCEESPRYVAVTEALPEALGTKVTKQFPEERTHDTGLKLPVAPVSENVTVPVGKIGPVEVSVTVAVQETGWLPITELIEQERLVAELCWPTKTVTTTEWTYEPDVALIVTL